MQKKQMLGGNIDVLIDDYVENIIGGDYFSILLSYPWNENFCTSHYSSYRCNDWNEINEALKTIEFATSF